MHESSFFETKVSPNLVATPSTIKEILFNKPRCIFQRCVEKSKLSTCYGSLFYPPNIHFQQFKLFTLSIFCDLLVPTASPLPLSLLPKVIIQTNYSLVCSSFLSIGMAKYRLNISRYILKTSKHHDKCMTIKKKSTSPLAYNFFSQNLRFWYPFKKTSPPLCLSTFRKPSLPIPKSR